MTRYIIRLIDGSSLPILDDEQGDIVGIKDDKMLFARHKMQSKTFRVPWTSVLKIEEVPPPPTKPAAPAADEEKPPEDGAK